MTASEELVRRTTFSVTGSPASMSVPCELLLLVGAVLTPLLLAYAERSVLLVAPDGERSALQDRTENNNRFKTKAHSHKLANRAPWVRDEVSIRSTLKHATLPNVHKLVKILEIRNTIGNEDSSSASQETSRSDHIFWGIGGIR